MIVCGRPWAGGKKKPAEFRASTTPAQVGTRFRPGTKRHGNSNRGRQGGRGWPPCHGKAKNRRVRPTGAGLVVPSCSGESRAVVPPEAGMDGATDGAAQRVGLVAGETDVREGGCSAASYAPRPPTPYR